MASPRRSSRGTPGKGKQQTLDRCAHCGSTLLKRHIALHGQLCSESQPFDEVQWDTRGLAHGLLHQGTIYSRTKLTQQHPAEINLLDSWLKRNVVVLAPTTMQFCQLAIGDHLALLVRGSGWRAVLVLPDDSLDPFELGVPEGSFLPVDVPCRLRRATVMRASELTLTTDEWKQLYDSSAFRIYCGNYLLNAVLPADAAVCIPYFGMDCHFKALIDEADAMPSLLHAMEVTECDNPKNARLESSTCVFYAFSTKTTISVSRSNPSVPSTLRFEHLIGLGQAKDDLNRYVVFPLRLYSRGRIGVQDFQVRTVLFYGPPGCGKTTLAIATANEANASLNSLNHEHLTKLELTVQRATIFLLDDIDRMAKGSNADIISKVLSQVRVCKCPALLVATVQSRGNLPGEIRSLFDVEVEVPVPTTAERRSIVEALAANRPSTLSGVDFDDIALMTQGCTPSDLKNLFKEALCSLQTTWYLEGNNRAMLNREVLLKAAKKLQPSAMREITLDIPAVKWSDIGGEPELKRKLQQMVEWPLKHPDAFQRLGVRPPKGILMYGPPGCSKTMIARALATEGNLNFLAVKGPELFSKYVGESEKAVREIFRKARQVAPAVIFFDELDALASSRSHDQAAVGNRVLAQLLTEMDGIEPLNEVVIVAATNRPDMIDDALLRPGRLDRLVEVPLPDERTRQEIFLIRLARMPVDKANIDIERLVKATQGFSGAEVSSLCDEAALLAMQEDINAKQVCLSHFDQAFKIVRPRTSKTLLAIYDAFRRRGSVDSS